MYKFMLSKKKIFFYIISFQIFILSGCKTVYVDDFKPIQSIFKFKKKDLTLEEFKVWHHKDILEDTIPGISLDKAYRDLIKNKKGKEIIVAVIDMEVDIDHEDIKDNIWFNKNEIPGNNIDDDKNGYIDDIHGWNFLGNNKGENIIFANYEYTRIIREFDSLFKDKDVEEITTEQESDFLMYKRAKEKYKKRMDYALEEKDYIDYYENGYLEASKALEPYFPNKNYNIVTLDSIKKHVEVDDELKKHLDYMDIYMEYNLSEEWISDYKLKTYERLDKLLNLDYNERVVIIGDNPEDISDINYGNNKVNANLHIKHHGTLVTGAIAALRKNQTEAKGISDNIQIMPLCLFPYGDEHDKDMALAIRYAVDNGAKVINISSAKEFSLHNDWVNEAMKYAERNEVLIISAAGNDSCNLDDTTFFSYPNDIDINGFEISNNFIMVASSTNFLDKRLGDIYSNFGKKNVDIYAPGENIYTTSAKKEKYIFNSGTSLSSAVVSGVAALIRSYYPKLTAPQVKEIIMESGVSYDIDVEIEQEDGTKKLVPFSELSKSGKIVNAYNALLMAEQVSKRKKK